MELLRKRLANLLAVKSIVTLILTAVFAYLSVSDHVTTDQFLTVFTVVIAVPSRFMRKFICRLRLNEVSRQ